jgi:hypothetical protein
MQIQQILSPVLSDDSEHCSYLQFIKQLKSRKPIKLCSYHFMFLSEQFVCFLLFVLPNQGGGD